MFWYLMLSDFLEGKPYCFTTSSHKISEQRNGVKVNLKEKKTSAKKLAKKAENEQ